MTNAEKIRHGSSILIRAHISDRTGIFSERLHKNSTGPSSLSENLGQGEGAPSGARRRTTMEMEKAISGVFPEINLRAGRRVVSSGLRRLPGPWN